jgi:hypothetical protein
MQQIHKWLTCAADSAENTDHRQKPKGGQRLRLGHGVGLLHDT